MGSRHRSKRSGQASTPSLAAALIESLSHGDRDEREMALARLSFDGAKNAILGVVLALNDNSEGVRVTALQILRGSCPEAESIADAAYGAVVGPDSLLRLQVIRDLATLVPSIRDARAAQMPGWRELEGLINLGTEAPMVVDRFDTEYPEELPDRLQWLESHLSVNRGRLLQLLGLSREEAFASEKRGWPEILAQVEPQVAERVEHLLTHYLSYFGYDSEEAAQFSRRFPDRVKSGEVDLEEYIPDYRDGASPAKREEALRTAIFEEGPGLLPALATFLFSPSLPCKPAASPAALEALPY